MEHRNSAIAMFVEHARVETAIRRLKQVGIDPRRITIVGKGHQTDQNVIGYYTG